jgi:hypothetical protein
MPAELAPLAQSMMLDMPPVFERDPDMRAVQHCHALEVERMESTLQALRLELNPLTAGDLGLSWFEVTLRLPVRPAEPLEERRSTVLSVLQRQNIGPGENDWIIAVTRIVGPGWTYEEHDPDDAGSPPAYTVRITLPFAPSSDLYARMEQRIRDVTPAHVDIVLSGGAGFILDQSQLDQEPLTY